MTISASDRAYLLGSKSYMVQIQRILKQQLDQTMDLDQLRSFYHDLSEGRFRSTIYSMSAKGIISLLIRVLNGRTPQEILSTELYFIDAIGLAANLSPTRANGLVAMIKQMRLYALAFEAKEKEQKHE